MHNILYIANSGNLFGGGEVSLYYLVKGLDQKLFKPIVLCPAKGNLVDAFTRINVKTIIISLPSLKTLKLLEIIQTFAKLIRIIKKFQIDCIHSNSSRASIYSSLAGLLSRVPLIAHFRVVPSDGIVDRFIAAFASRVIVVSKAAGERFCWLEDKKKKIIYNGVDTKVFRPNHPDRFRREEFNLKDTDLVIGAIGRISPEKGLDILLEALVRLRDMGRGVALIIFGKGDEGYTSKLKQFTENHQLENVIFAGFRKETESIYPSIDILCLSSFTEAFNRSILEAMACGVPVVATDVGGNPEAVIENRTGFLVPPNDPEKLADALAILTDDKELRNQLGKRGLARVRQKYSIENNIQQTQDVYKRLIRRPN